MTALEQHDDGLAGVSRTVIGLIQSQYFSSPSSLASFGAILRGDENRVEPPERKSAPVGDLGSTAEAPKGCSLDRTGLLGGRRELSLRATEFATDPQASSRDSPLR